MAVVVVVVMVMATMEEEQMQPRVNEMSCLITPKRDFIRVLSELTSACTNVQATLISDLQKRENISLPSRLLPRRFFV